MPKRDPVWLGLALCALLAGGCLDYADLGPAGDGGEQPDADGELADGLDGPDDARDQADGPDVDCPTFIGALADCPFAYRLAGGARACPEVVCLERPCAADGDCPVEAGVTHGDRCVQGNCVFCVHDGHCPAGQLCRTGRCVEPIVGCPPAPACAGDYSGLVSPSELPCPVCLWMSFFEDACATDPDCVPNDNLTDARCVYGRCVSCLSDADCGGWSCLPPGICMFTSPHANALYGTWLLGWSGGMEHRSYFRFEPDGAFRRGSYAASGPFADDIAPFPCQPPGGIPAVSVGTWETDMSQAIGLSVTVNLNIACDPGAGFVGHRIRVTFAADGGSATFESSDFPMVLDGWKVPAASCAPDMSSCEAPSLPAP
jgi:Cys-rich repeat protein